MHLEDGLIPEQETVFVYLENNLALTTKSDNFFLKT